MSFCNVCELAKRNQFMVSAVRVLSLPGRAETGDGGQGGHSESILTLGCNGRMP